MNGKRVPKGLCKHAFLRVFVIFAWLGTMPISVAAPPCTDFTFEFRAEPSFLVPSVVRLQTHPRSARLSIQVGDKLKENPALDRDAAHAFCARLLGALAIKQDGPPSIGLDGIEVHGNLKMTASPDVNFSFSSPERAHQPRDFAVVESVFLLLESTTPSCLLNTYLEQLAAYFPFGIKVRRFAGPPLTLRVYGSLTIDDIDDFDRIVDSLPSNVPLVKRDMDMTNFNGMGTLLYESFGPLLSRSPAVEWKVSPQAARQLREVGVADSALEMPREMYCAGQPRRFSRR